MFNSSKEIKDKLFEADYIASDIISTTIYLASKLRKPILIEGPPGVGKTDLAKSLATTYGYSFIKLQCYEGIDESKALYEWEYSKQLLYTQILKDHLDQVVSGDNFNDIVKNLSSFDSIFFSENFLIERPLLKAIKNVEPTILLIDEIDKSEPEFEAFLLELMGEYQITIPEIGTIEPKQYPLIFLTSNSQRSLSDPLRRRALYLYIDYPSMEIEREIIYKKIPEIDKIDIDKIVQIIQKIRSLPLKKSPGISETIEWAKSLFYISDFDISKDSFEKTINILVKHRGDYQLLKSKIYDLL